MKYLDQFGETGVSAGDRQHLNAPIGVAVVKDGSKLVTDGGYRIIRLSEDLKYIDQFGETNVAGTDREHLGDVPTMAIQARDGSILVCDNGNFRIIRLSEDLKYIDQFGETGVFGTDRQHIRYTTGIAVTRDGSILVFDRRNYRIIRLSEDLKYLDQFGQTGGLGSDRQHLERLGHGITIAEDGSIIVVDLNNHRLVRLTENLKFIDQFGETGVAGTDRQHFNTPQVVAIAEDDSLLVTDRLNSRVVRLTPDLQYMDQFGETGVAGTDRKHFNFCSGLACDQDGSILVCDEGNHRIVRLSED